MLYPEKWVYFYPSTRPEIYGILIGEPDIKKVLSKEVIEAFGLDFNMQEALRLEEVVRFDCQPEEVLRRLHKEHFLAIGSKKIEIV